MAECQTTPHPKILQPQRMVILGKQFIVKKRYFVTWLHSIEERKIPKIIEMRHKNNNNNTFAIHTKHPTRQIFKQTTSQPNSQPAIQPKQALIASGFAF